VTDSPTPVLTRTEIELVVQGLVEISLAFRHWEAETRAIAQKFGREDDYNRFRQFRLEHPRKKHDP
jgi:hypothetical protein